MRLTREECEKALEFFKNLNYVDEDGVMRSSYNCDDLDYPIPTDWRISIDILSSLIAKHFDNPPLKFEELEENMWVWDNKTKSYIYIFKPLDWDPIKGIRCAERIINYSAYGYYTDFEENRFYHREVKDDYELSKAKENIKEVLENIEV